MPNKQYMSVCWNTSLDSDQVLSHVSLVGYPAENLNSILFFFFLFVSPQWPSVCQFHLPGDGLMCTNSRSDDFTATGKVLIKASAVCGFLAFTEPTSGSVSIKPCWSLIGPADDGFYMDRPCLTQTRHVGRWTLTSVYLLTTCCAFLPMKKRSPLMKPLWSRLPS